MFHLQPQIQNGTDDEIQDLMKTCLPFGIALQHVAPTCSRSLPVWSSARKQKITTAAAAEMHLGTESHVFGECSSLMDDRNASLPVSRDLIQKPFLNQVCVTHFSTFTSSLKGFG